MGKTPFVFLFMDLDALEEGVKIIISFEQRENVQKRRLQEELKVVSESAVEGCLLQDPLVDRKACPGDRREEEGDVHHGGLGGCKHASLHP